jgi:hypothetical protein
MNKCNILVGKTQTRISLGRQRCRLVDDVKMDLKCIGLHSKDWIDLAQDRNQWRAPVNMVVNR